jgi:hypothetical protein
MTHSDVANAVAKNAKSAGIEWRTSSLPLIFRFGHAPPNSVAFALMVAVYQSCNGLSVDGILDENTISVMRGKNPT